MPTAVVRLDTDALPDCLQCGERYDHALLVMSWRGRVAGHCTVPLQRGELAGAVLRDAVAAHAATTIATWRTEAWTGFDVFHDVVRPRATVAVCTRDRLDDLEACLRAIAALPDDGQEVLVIDNASRDGEGVRALVARHAGVRYVREDRPGLDIARNRALHEATGEFVVFCDDDAVVDTGWLRAMSRNFGDPRTLCVTGLIMPQELETPAQEWFERTNGFSRGFNRVVHDGAVQDAFFVSRVGAGASMALRRSVLELIGPFDEALDAGTPTKSGGDHDYFTRILLAGYCITYEPAALSWHRHRREWVELRDTVRGYGTGVWAYLTRHTLAGEWRAPTVAVVWGYWQVRNLVRGLLGLRTTLPVDLAAAELRGCLAGPGAYLRSRRRAREATG